MRREDIPLPPYGRTPLFHKFLNGELGEKDVDSNGVLAEQRSPPREVCHEEGSSLIDVYLQEMRRLDSDSTVHFFTPPSCDDGAHVTAGFEDTTRTELFRMHAFLENKIVYLEERMRIAENENTSVRRALASFGIRVPNDVYETDPAH